MTTRLSRSIHKSIRCRRPPVAVAAALLLLASLAGCGGATADKNAPPTMTGAAPHGEAPSAPAAAPATPIRPAETATAIAAPAPEPATRYPEPATMTGLDADKLAGLLGAPRFKRRDDPAEIWQYRNEACSLDVFLYRAGKDGAYRVRHFEARGRDAKSVDQKDCFVSLLKAREQGRAG